MLNHRYTCALGHAAGALVEAGATGLMATVGNLAGPAAEWTVGGTPLTGMMCVQQRAWKRICLLGDLVRLQADTALSVAWWPPGISLLAANTRPPDPCAASLSVSNPEEE